MVVGGSGGAGGNLRRRRAGGGVGEPASAANPLMTAAQDRALPAAASSLLSSVAAVRPIGSGSRLTLPSPSRALAAAASSSEEFRLAGGVELRELVDRCRPVIAKYLAKSERLTSDEEEQLLILADAVRNSPDSDEKTRILDEGQRGANLGGMLPFGHTPLRDIVQDFSRDDDSYQGTPGKIPASLSDLVVRKDNSRVAMRAKSNKIDELIAVCKPLLERVVRDNESSLMDATGPMGREDLKHKDLTPAEQRKVACLIKVLESDPATEAAITGAIGYGSAMLARRSATLGDALALFRADYPHADVETVPAELRTMVLAESVAARPATLTVEHGISLTPQVSRALSDAGISGITISELEKGIAKKIFVNSEGGVVALTKEQEIAASTVISVIMGVSDSKKRFTALKNLAELLPDSFSIRTGPKEEDIRRLRDFTSSSDLDRVEKGIKTEVMRIAQEMSRELEAEVARVREELDSRGEAKRAAPTGERVVEGEFYSYALAECLDHFALVDVASRDEKFDHPSGEEKVQGRNIVSRESLREHLRLLEGHLRNPEYSMRDGREASLIHERRAIVNQRTKQLIDRAWEAQEKARKTSEANPNVIELAGGERVTANVGSDDLIKDLTVQPSTTTAQHKPVTISIPRKNPDGTASTEHFDIIEYHPIEVKGKGVMYLPSGVSILAGKDMGTSQFSKEAERQLVEGMKEYNKILTAKKEEAKLVRAAPVMTSTVAVGVRAASPPPARISAVNSDTGSILTEGLFHSADSNASDRDSGIVSASGSESGSTARSGTASETTRVYFSVLKPAEITTAAIERDAKAFPATEAEERMAQKIFEAASGNKVLMHSVILIIRELTREEPDLSCINAIKKEMIKANPGLKVQIEGMSFGKVELKSLSAKNINTVADRVSASLATLEIEGREDISPLGQQVTGNRDVIVVGKSRYGGDATTARIIGKIVDESIYGARGVRYYQALADYKRSGALVKSLNSGSSIGGVDLSKRIKRSDLSSIHDAVRQTAADIGESHSMGSGRISLSDRGPSDSGAGSSGSRSTDGSDPELLPAASTTAASLMRIRRDSAAAADSERGSRPLATTGVSLRSMTDSARRVTVPASGEPTSAGAPPASGKTPRVTTAKAVRFAEDGSSEGEELSAKGGSEAFARLLAARRARDSKAATAKAEATIGGRDLTRSIIGAPVPTPQVQGQASRGSRVRRGGRRR